MAVEKEITDMIYEEAYRFVKHRFTGDIPKDCANKGYTAGRMKGVEETIEFAEWVNLNFERLGTEGFTADKWIGRSLKYRGDVYTTTELLTIFYQQKEKA